ncbi:MAG: four helix bundle protein [Bacteroidetes bacterium]|nr:four helix bundle protein [Bacteroidota bacterium]
MHKIQELKIWQKSMELATDVYNATSTFPKEETYGLVSQIRRCAVSIPSNIAEGAGRNSDGEFCHFLGISNGSSFELQTQLIISNKLKMIDDAKLNHLIQCINEIQKMNYKLQQSMKTKQSRKNIKQ